MLDEFDIRNFAIIDHLHLRFQGGLTVLTGETGAGKSIIIDALGILLGGRAGADMIREGEAQARLEGIFLLPDDPALQATLAEYGVESEDGALIVARELTRGGRSGARLNGRAVPVSAVQQISQRLVDIHGQTEHLALLRAADQLGLLDRYAGLTAGRERMAALVRRLRHARAEITRLAGDQRDAARRLDLLRYQIEEIDTAGLTPGEEAVTESELRVLASAEKLRQLAGQLHGVLAGAESEAVSAEDVLGQAVGLAAEVVRIDPAQQATASRLEAAFGEVQEAAREMRRYADGVEDDPARLAQLLDRQELIRGLKRKYGASVEEVLAFREQAAAEAAAIGHSDERRLELQEEAASVAAEAGVVAGDLSAARQRAAGQLAARVQQELATLNMGGATFQVHVSRQADASGLHVAPEADPLLASPMEHSPGTTGQVRATAEGGNEERPSFAFDLTGIDQVEFLVAPNVGESPKPVARIASGGETSRIMLALKSALSEADQTATLVFDEVDVGVGGRSGRVIGEKLWQLARHHQVLCITHLPQVAVYGGDHQKIRKVVAAGRTATAVESLNAEERVEEVAQMFGGATVTATTRRAAHDLLAQAEEWKRQATSD